jgi:hypothetical protein
MSIGLFEDEQAHLAFLPITRTRPLWQVWWGMDRLIHKWARYYGWEVTALWPPINPLLHPLYPAQLPAAEDAKSLRSLLWINTRLLPWTPELPRIAEALPPQSAYRYKNEILMARGMPHHARIPMEAGICATFLYPSSLAARSASDPPPKYHRPFPVQWAGDRGGLATPF